MQRGNRVFFRLLCCNSSLKRMLCSGLHSTVADLDRKGCAQTTPTNYICVHCTCLAVTYFRGVLYPSGEAMLLCGSAHPSTLCGWCVMTIYFLFCVCAVCVYIFSYMYCPCSFVFVFCLLVFSLCIALCFCFLFICALVFMCFVFLLPCSFIFL